MLNDVKELLADFLARGLISDLFTISGFILALLLVARLMSQKKAPANTFAWLLVIILLPYVGVPLYLIFGGRKLRQLAARKAPLRPHVPEQTPGASVYASWPVAHTIMSSGAGAPVAGNRLQLLTTGEDTFRALENAIRAAKDTIHINTFILGRDETGGQLLELLAERARAGVKVRLLLDAVGCMFVRRSYHAALRQAGEVVTFMPVLPFTSRGSANLRNHRKIAVFDHSTAIIGGHNLAREYMGPTPYRKRWRDLGALIEGPAASLLNEVFIADWCFANRQSPEVVRPGLNARTVMLRGSAELQVVASGPDVPGDPLYEGIISMIQEAEHSIWIVTPYFIPDDVLLRSLIVKARAGREVTLIVPERSNHPVTDFARKHYLRELCQAGGRVLLFQPGMMHSKAVIVDDRIGLLGSANFDLRSLFVNFEIGVVVHTKAEALMMKAWAQTQAESCREFINRPKRPHQLLANMFEDFSRLLAPLL